MAGQSYNLKKTITQFDEASRLCREIFANKMKDYGSAWRVLRTSSITDQIFIKAQRIRSFEDKGIQKVEEGIKSEYIGIVNYCVIGLIQLSMANDKRMDIPDDEGLLLFDKYINDAKKLMENKNHDYDEAWREMRISSLTDLILMKLLRTKQIEDNKGQTIISEGIDANYFDMINYAIFALIKLSEGGAES